MSRVILIPGLLCDDLVWQPVLKRLGGKADVAALRTQDNLTDMAQDCLDQHPGQLAVFGHSMGARVAMEMARLAPERIECLGLLDTGIHPLTAGEPERRAEVVQFARDNGMQALADRWLPGMIHEPHQANPDVMGPLNDMVLRMDPELHARQINALVNRPDASSYLAGITCPVLLVVGRQDKWSPLSQHQDMLKLLPDARLEIIENAGHFAPVEQPDDVADAVVSFIKEKSKEAEHAHC